jgi:hypothetical protein
VKHHASRRFWRLFEELPEDVRELADEKFELLKTDPITPRFISSESAAFGQFALGGTIAPWATMYPTASSGSGSGRMLNTTSWSGSRRGSIANMRYLPRAPE